MKQHGDDRGPAFYLGALTCAQSLWLQGLPAQAILQLNRAFAADLRGDEAILTNYPLPYAPMVWIFATPETGAIHRQSTSALPTPRHPHVRPAIRSSCLARLGLLVDRLRHRSLAPRRRGTTRHGVHRGTRICGHRSRIGSNRPPGRNRMLDRSAITKPSMKSILFSLLLTCTALSAADRTWQGIPGLERTAKGRVFVSWFSGGPKEPSPENTVYLSSSDDQGATFAPPIAMGLPKDGTRCYDPTLWIDPKGRLWYIFNRGNKETATHDVWARICDAPDAAKLIWSNEIRVGYEAPYAFRMNKPTVLSSGEWIMPVTHAEERISDWFAGPKQLQGIGISTDEGQTWKLHGSLKAPEWALECMITELRDGHLWMLIRTGSGVLWQSHSTDKGVTWSEPGPSTIANPGSRFFIRRLASGNLLLVNHYKFERAQPPHRPTLRR